MAMAGTISSAISVKHQNPILVMNPHRKRYRLVTPPTTMVFRQYTSTGVGGDGGGCDSFPCPIGSSRNDWLSSCAILSSKAIAISEEEQKQKGIDDGEEPAEGGGSDGILSLSITNNQQKEQQQSLDLVPLNSGNLLRPLTIADLCPPPMHGSPLRVAYQGVPGAYSEAAANKAYPNCEAIPCDQFEVAFQAVERWIADRAVLPVENSLGGSIHRNYDLLLRHRLHIVGEVQLPVHHCLLALPGVKKQELRRVISHPQALSQCEQTLTNKLGLSAGVAREAVDDTAGAAEFVANNGLRDTAAIASSRAAELYGMEILADGIQDDSGNVTRFVMLAREPVIPRTDRPFKTSIVFAHDKEGTSVLFKVLSSLAFRNIPLTKIESRPHRNRPIRLVTNGVDGSLGTAKHFEYMFYLDFEASMAEARAQNALAEIQEFTSFLRVLGSYPMDMTPWTAPPASSSALPSSSTVPASILSSCIKRERIFGLQSPETYLHKSKDHCKIAPHGISYSTG